MESLYVCLFSNGHIKVGRSIEPQSRIASHADRVACMGVELSDSFIAECAGPAIPRETWLIDRCMEAASRRFQSEWFEGLDFLTVCDLAHQAARLDIAIRERSRDSFSQRLRLARTAAGLTQTELGKGLGSCGADLMKATISQWEQGRHGPNVTQLRLLCERLNVSADYLIGVTQPA